MWTRRAMLGGAAAIGVSALLPKGSLAATDQLRVGLRAEPPHLDPTLDGNGATNDVSYQNLFEGLTSVDEAGKVGPGLAKSWTVSADALTYVFILQDEVRYHDGTSFDADHVVFSLTRLLSRQGPKRALFDAIATVTAIDPGSVKLVLKHADPQVLFNLGRPEAAIVAPESADNNRMVPIGTGPFALVQWDRGQRLLLQRNEDYWGPHPRMNEAIFVFIADPAAALEALAAHAIDGYPEFTAAEVPDRLKGDPAFKVVSGLAAGSPRVGVWSAGLEGEWANAPLGGCPLAAIRKTGDAAAPAPQPGPPDAADSD